MTGSTVESFDSGKILQGWSLAVGRVELGCLRARSVSPEHSWYRRRGVSAHDAVLATSLPRFPKKYQCVLRMDHLHIILVAPNLGAYFVRYNPGINPSKYRKLHREILSHLSNPYTLKHTWSSPGGEYASLQVLAWVFDCLVDDMTTASQDKAYITRCSMRAVLNIFGRQRDSFMEEGHRRPISLRHEISTWTVQARPLST